MLTDRKTTKKRRLVDNPGISVENYSFLGKTIFLPYVSPYVLLLPVVVP
jgi:hypothetical protein